MLGIVLDPFAGELFSAVKGGGPSATGSPSTWRTSPWKTPLSAFGTAPYYQELKDATFAVAKELGVRCGDLRRSGSAAVDLCHLAAGQLDGFFELRLSPWDYAASTVILQEAGAVTGTAPGQAFTFEEKQPFPGRHAGGVSPAGGAGGEIPGTAVMKNHRGTAVFFVWRSRTRAPCWTHDKSRAPLLRNGRGLLFLALEAAALLGGAALLAVAGFLIELVELAVLQAPGPGFISWGGGPLGRRLLGGAQHGPAGTSGAPGRWGSGPTQPGPAPAPGAGAPPRPPCPRPRNCTTSRWSTKVPRKLRMTRYSRYTPKPPPITHSTAPQDKLHHRVHFGGLAKFLLEGPPPCPSPCRRRQG